MKKVIVVILIAFIAIQLFRPAKNIDRNHQASANDISTRYNVPEDVKKMLGTSCYDCHSNNTVYPSYANIQPLGWWLNHHIEEGKDELNFSEFASYSIRRQYKKFDEIAEQIKKDEMPLSSYTFVHKNAVLNAEQKQRLTDWAISNRDTIKATYPADSLKKK